MNNEKIQNKKERKVFTNYDIFPGKIQLVGENGATVIDRDEAIAIAKSEGKTLVQIAYNKNSFPKAVCKIQDLGKLKYEQKKKQKEQAKKMKLVNSLVKEVCFSIRIDTNDKNTKIKHIKEFLSEKNKVKINIKLMRREMHLVDMAKELMKSILNELNGIAELDSNPSFNNGIMSCTVRAIK
jgi:translation initiation factor IF-3